MMDIKTLLILFMLSAMTVCQAASTGIVSMNIGGETRLYTLHKLKPYERVQFQYPDKTGLTRCCILHVAKSFEKVEDNLISSDAFGDEPVFQYRLVKSSGQIGAAPFLGMAVIGKAKIEKAPNLALKVKLVDGDLEIHSCTSQEGLHVMGDLNGKLVSDIYYNFDYQVENPTCVSK